MYQRFVREQFDLGYFQLAARQILVLSDSRTSHYFESVLSFDSFEPIFKAFRNNFTIHFTVESWKEAEDRYLALTKLYHGNHSLRQNS